VTDPRWQLVAYVFVSIILWMVAAQLSRRRTSISWVRSLDEGWAARVLRFGYFIGLPYMALILGVVPGRYLGLAGLDRLQVRQSFPPGRASAYLSQIRDDMSLVVLDWLPDVATIAGLGAVMFLLLSVTWLAYRYFRWGIISGLGTSPASIQRERNLLGAQVVYQAVHWSFYRSAVWLLSDDLYLGVVGGILLVGGEWMLGPGRTGGIPSAHPEEDLLINASVLVATSVIFFFVPNLWLLLPIHWLLETIGRRTVALRHWRMAGKHDLRL
jgi:hypothetical protein